MKKLSKKNILFYSPFDQRSRDTESIMLALKRSGHNVISLSHGRGTDIHQFLERFKIVTDVFLLPDNPAWADYIKQLLFLVRFCKKHKIDYVFSHLESANFISSLAQFFIKAKVIICRHHIDLAKLKGFSQSWSYRVTYFLARRIIVVSAPAKKYLIEIEKVRASKITHINLGYDFSLYPKPDLSIAKAIREKMGSSLVLLTVGRLSDHKRPGLAIQLLKKLRDRQIDASLILLGEGEDRSLLQCMIEQYELQSIVWLTGYVKNVMDYLAACDILLHPSLSEASCVVVKEAALVKRPVIVCRNVGDFNEYIIHGENGFLLQEENYLDEAFSAVLHLHRNPSLFKKIAENLCATVTENFNIDNTIEQYEHLLNEG